MELIFVPMENRLKLDLHGLDMEVAKATILDALDYCPYNIQVIIVVHGYSAGTKLLKITRSIKHKRIDHVKIMQNPGVTLFFLDPNYKMDASKQNTLEKRRRIKKAKKKLHNTKTTKKESKN